MQTLDFYFLFLFSKNYFYFQKIRILKIYLVSFLVFCFHKIKILKIYNILTSYIFVFLDLLKIIFIITVISFSDYFLFSFSLKIFSVFYFE